MEPSQHACDDIDLVSSQNRVRILSLDSRRYTSDAPNLAVKGAVRWGLGPGSGAGARGAPSSPPDDARASAAETVAVARMRAAEPRLAFDHCVVDTKSNPDRPRLRSRGNGPPKLTQATLVKDSGRPRQLAAELAYLASRMEAQGRVNPARACLERCVVTLEDALGGEHQDVGRAVRALADLVGKIPYPCLHPDSPLVNAMHVR
jgi:hypothetical protein